MVALGIQRRIQFKKYFKIGGCCQRRAESTGDLLLLRQPLSDFLCTQRISGTEPVLLAQVFDSSEILGWKIESHCFKGRNDRMWEQTGYSELVLRFLSRDCGRLVVTSGGGGGGNGIIGKGLNLYHLALL